ncbi:MAG TPA: ABC transporter permease [Anaerolineales bacterium]|nr:ABC transporter permease [Anaerolineales bacterium]
MRNIWTIAKREFLHYFKSPIAYIVALAVFLVIGIYFVVIMYFVMNQALTSGSSTAPDISIVVSPMATIFLFATPALTMRLLADEQRMGTLELLLTAPVRDAELVIGKWLGSFLFVLTIIAVSFIYPVVLNRLTLPGIDQGVMIAGYVAIILMVGTYLAIGTAMSSFFSNQIAAFFATLGTLLFFWWLVRLPTYIIQTGFINSLCTYLDLNGRFNSMMAGSIALSDAIYPVSLIVLSLIVGSVAVEMKRWR